MIIFPDQVDFDEALTAKTEHYLKRGGKVLLSGKSGITADGNFFTDFGVKYIGRSSMDASYLIPAYDMKPNGMAPYLMYERGHLIEAAENVEILGYMQDSYFNRSLRRFCSHGNTPNNPESRLPGVILSGNIGYIAWNIFEEYGKNGAYHQKRVVCDLIDHMLGDRKTLSTNLPSNGIVTLMEQKEQNRSIVHLLYAVTKKRGDTEVIEDAVAITDTQVSIRLPQKPYRVYLAPEEKDISYTYEKGRLSFTVDTFKLHGMVVIEKAE